jgi:hypothetical protein
LERRLKKTSKKCKNKQGSASSTRDSPSLACSVLALDAFRVSSVICLQGRQADSTGFHRFEMKSRINKILEDAGHGIQLNSEGNVTRIRGAAYFTVCDFTDFATMRRFAWAVMSRIVRACVLLCVCVCVCVCVCLCVCVFAFVGMSWILNDMTTYEGYRTFSNNTHVCAAESTQPQR